MELQSKAELLELFTLVTNLAVICAYSAPYLPDENCPLSSSNCLAKVEQLSLPKFICTQGFYKKTFVSMQICNSYRSICFFLLQGRRTRAHTRECAHLEHA